MAWHPAPARMIGDRECCSALACGALRPHNIDGKPLGTGLGDSVRSASTLSGRRLAVPHGNKTLGTLQQRAVGVLIRRAVRARVIEEQYMGGGGKGEG
jgi:hypothetical protein